LITVVLAVSVSQVSHHISELRLKVKFVLGSSTTKALGSSCACGGGVSFCVSGLVRLWNSSTLRAASLFSFNHARFREAIKNMFKNLNL